jgi:hypothetical protein
VPLFDRNISFVEYFLSLSPMPFKNLRCYAADVIIIFDYAAVLSTDRNPMLELNPSRFFDLFYFFLVFFYRLTTSEGRNWAEMSKLLGLMLCFVGP